MALVEFYNGLANEIKTERLILRRPIITDAKTIASLANNKKIHDMLARLPYPYKIDHAIEFINEIARTDNEYTYGICLQGGKLKGGELIGLISFAKYEEKIELGYWLGEEFWGKGYASEAIKALLEEALKNKQCPKIIARSISSNKASINLLKKVGLIVTKEKIADCGVHKGIMITYFEFKQ